VLQWGVMRLVVLLASLFACTVDGPPAVPAVEEPLEPEPATELPRDPLVEAPVCEAAPELEAVLRGDAMQRCATALVGPDEVDARAILERLERGLDEEERASLDVCGEWASALRRGTDSRCAQGSGEDPVLSRLRGYRTLIAYLETRPVRERAEVALGALELGATFSHVGVPEIMMQERLLRSLDGWMLEIQDAALRRRRAQLGERLPDGPTALAANLDDMLSRADEDAARMAIARLLVRTRGTCASWEECERDVAAIELDLLEAARPHQPTLRRLQHTDPRPEDTPAVAADVALTLWSSLAADLRRRRALHERLASFTP